MNTSNQPSNDKLFVARALEASIHIGLVGLLLFWCFKIGQPFIEIIVWGIIIAVAIHPIYDRLKSALGGRGRLAATLITLLALIVLLVPTYYAFRIPHRHCTGVFGTARRRDAKCTSTIGERQILAGHRRTFIQVLEPWLKQISELR